ncbi:50S ribosomal protein L24 [bacterium (Candidatus Gribaldobacteria) CG_4_10_14_0_2_um_filter_41_16]|uniref:Large ribosomal subunit protein uL24 n=3 Tax=Candidatus Gribaldobacteria TaxID=2798536 RepID=A0A2M7VIZ2_9BACT|nr:MAG: 50S ribosomal protein L24 [bacterium (Candidatus Gribaldobacteria) CG10_big_fil_rev_8_21_14_0_10_41_12]PIV46973.1 MAG: 50S ribosomal protein L24 [bacterium (Candidatus Gribaldobacteria) CG02_land_8_20_14_3_00_41_15]PJA01629.1 MAG: 50S ribosomal protein L24 [bacterium (Candidatus Gribaldobacteria) CG_4_10_14_0_2_um_filter_41_16]
MRIKKGDQVLIIKGKDKKKKGKVARTFSESNKVLLEGLNLKKTHKRGRKEGEKGQVVEIATPLAVASVMFICPKCGQPARLGYLIKEQSKSRVCKKCGAEV